MNTANEWQAMLERDVAFAERALIAHGQLLPMAVMHAADDALHVIPLAASSDSALESSNRFLRLMVVKHDAKAVSHMGEMWARHMAPYARESDAEYTERVMATRPRDAEDRREVVMVQLWYRDRDGEAHELSTSRDIIRGDDGKVTGLGPAPDWDVIESEGPWSNMLPPSRPNREQRRYAAQLLDRLYSTSQVPVPRRPS